jgi:signal transduction histidine kinase
MINENSMVLTNQDPITEHGFMYRLGKQLLRFRWYLILGLGLFVLFFEGLEFFEQSDVPPFSDPHVRAEILLYLGIITIVALLAQVYVNLLKMHSRALKLLELKHVLSQDLTRAKDWNDVCEHICQKLGEFGSFDEVFLFTYKNDSGAYQAAASWKTGDVVSSLAQELPQILAKACIRQDADHSYGLEPCPLSSKISELDPAGCYCLPIHDHRKPVARLFFHLSPGVKLAQETSDLLETTADEIAIALTTARLRQERAETRIAEASAEIRRIISQDLHDTIGQNLAYLRMRLDQFSQEEFQEDLAMVKPDLESMRDLANTSYELVRGLLVAMSPEASMHLDKLLEYEAKLVSERTGIHIDLLRYGQSRNLNPSVIHHIYFIFREALNNIERHARAQNVTVNVHWSEEELQIKISDDGMGFDPEHRPRLAHYGLTIMNERATSLGGRLEILSSADEGTHVSLWLPLEA